MKIKETKNSPFVNLSVDDCTFFIKGNSFSDNLSEIYDKVIDWIDNEMPKIECPIECKYNFYVYNSITYKNILLMMSKFSELQATGKSIKIIWYYEKEDEDSLAIGEDIKDLFNLPVQIIEN